MNDPFDREPTLEELAQITPEDLELDAKLRRALEDYQKEHPEYVP
jgi:hypothetical protein